MAHLGGVLGGAAQHLLLQAIDLGVDVENVAGLALEADVLLGVHKGELVDVEELAPLRVHGALGVGAEQPVQAESRRCSRRGASWWRGHQGFRALSSTWAW